MNCPNEVNSCVAPALYQRVKCSQKTSLLHEANLLLSFFLSIREITYTKLLDRAIYTQLDTLLMEEWMLI